MRTKVMTGQSPRIVLNLDDSAVEIEALNAQLRAHPIDGLLEVMVIRDQRLMQLFP
jgi:hypothetical protein